MDAECAKTLIILFLLAISLVWLLLLSYFQNLLPFHSLTMHYESKEEKKEKNKENEIKIQIKATILFAHIVVDIDMETHSKLNATMAQTTWNDWKTL